jgi:CHAD domain-containing protein
MSYRVSTAADAGEELRRIAREEMSKAKDDLRNDDRHRGIHDFRRHCKKLRALLRAFRPILGEAYERENRAFRDAARCVAGLRDVSSTLDAFDGLVKRYGDAFGCDATSVLRNELVARRSAAVQGSSLEDRVREALDAVSAAEGRVASWDVGDATGFDAVASGVGRTYRRARKAMARAGNEPSSTSFHEWRKRVKYHRYHLQLLRDTWRPVLDRMHGQLDVLTDLLGDEHDLAVLGEFILAFDPREQAATARQEMVDLIEVRRAELRSLARPLGARLFADSASNQVHRLRTYWDARTVERGLHATR